MTDSLYKVIQLVGSSPNGWEDAVQKAVEDAANSLRDIRVVTVDELDCKVEDGKITAYRARVRLSFKYEA